MNSKDEPVCVIELIDVQVKPFLHVDEEFAFLEGEGDRSYLYWKTAHERFFTDYGKEIGLEWNSKTQSVVCEKFRVLQFFPRPPSNFISEPASSPLIQGNNSQKIRAGRENGHSIPCATAHSSFLIGFHINSLDSL